MGQRVGLAGSCAGDHRERPKGARSRCAMLDGATRFRIETVEVGGCRLHGVDGRCVKKLDSVIPLWLQRLPHFLAGGRNLSSGAEKYLEQLKRAVWSEDEAGRWEFGSDVVEGVFRRIFSNLSIGQLFEQVRSEARNDFPQD